MGAAALAAGAAAVACVAVALRRGWLDRSGAAAALAAGLLLLAAAGAAETIWLLAFFVAASAATEWRARRGEEGGRLRTAGAAGRSAAQVVANGGVAVGCALLGAAGWLPASEAAVLGSLAAALADTLGTEVGVALGGRPRLVTTWRPVAPGTSGAVSPAGTAASLAGAGAMGGLAAALAGGPAAGWVAAGLAGGAAGSAADSLLGATVEGRVPGVDNEAVNLAGTAVGAAVGWLAAAPWLAAA